MNYSKQQLNDMCVEILDAIPKLLKGQQVYEIQLMQLRSQIYAFGEAAGLVNKPKWDPKKDPCPTCGSRRLIDEDGFKLVLE